MYIFQQVWYAVIANINLPITNNNSFKQTNLKLLSFSICNNNFPLRHATIHTHQWTDTTDSRVKMNVFVQVKMAGIIFKVFENLLMTQERCPF